MKTSKQKSSTKAKQPSTYKQNVLEVNANLKIQSKSLGGCRSILLDMASEIGMNRVHVKILKDSKKPENYKILKKYVRTSKNGNYCPFYVLQALNNHGERLQNAFAANAKEAAKAA